MNLKFTAEEFVNQNIELLSRYGELEWNYYLTKPCNSFREHYVGIFHGNQGWNPELEKVEFDEITIGNFMLHQLLESTHIKDELEICRRDFLVYKELARYKYKYKYQETKVKEFIKNAHEAIIKSIKIQLEKKLYGLSEWKIIVLCKSIDCQLFLKYKNDNYTYEELISQNPLADEEYLEYQAMNKKCTCCYHLEKFRNRNIDEPF